MSMNAHSMDKPMTAEDAFDITLLVTCEIVKNVLLERTTGQDKVSRYRRGMLKKMDNIIEEVNRTYAGYLPDSFQNKAERYHKMIEADMNYLLKGYKSDGYRDRSKQKRTGNAQ
jgi:hypothetical protein